MICVLLEKGRPVLADPLLYTKYKNHHNAHIWLLSADKSAGGTDPAV